MKGCVRSQPAALTNTSIRPAVRARASLAQAATLAPSVSSRLMKSTAPPLSAMVSWAPAALTSHNSTRAPAAASISTVALPMPEAPPVITTVLCLSSMWSPSAGLTPVFSRGSGPLAATPGRTPSRPLAAGAGQELVNAPLRFLRCQQAPGPFRLRRKAVAFRIARQAHAHLGRRQAERRQPGEARRDRLGLGGKRAARHRPLHHAELARGGAVDPFAGEQQACGDTRAGDPGQALRAAAARQQAEPDLRQPEPGLVSGDAQIAAERQLEATAHGGAADFGEADLGQAADAFKQGLERSRHLGGGRKLVVAGKVARNLVEVGAGRKRAPGAADVQHATIPPSRPAIGDAVDDGQPDCNGTHGRRTV